MKLGAEEEERVVEARSAVSEDVTRGSSGVAIGIDESSLGRLGVHSSVSTSLFTSGKAVVKMKRANVTVYRNCQGITMMYQGIAVT